MVVGTVCVYAAVAALLALSRSRCNQAQTGNKPGNFGNALLAIRYFFDRPFLFFGGDNFHFLIF